ncbi:Cyclic AMP-responsive element-binding protein 3-like protein 4, partial [Neolecta irregularis DAH-3]
FHLSRQSRALAASSSTFCPFQKHPPPYQPPFSMAAQCHSNYHLNLHYSAKDVNPAAYLRANGTIDPSLVESFQTPATRSRAVKAVRVSPSIKEEDDDDDESFKDEPMSPVPELSAIPPRPSKKELDDEEVFLNSEEGKKLSSKERRQIRNKVSARNFRVRRKGLSPTSWSQSNHPEYINQLEELVQKQNSENSKLREQVIDLKRENRRITEVSNADLEKLKAENKKLAQDLLNLQIQQSQNIPQIPAPESMLPPSPPPFDTAVYNQLAKSWQQPQFFDNGPCKSPKDDFLASGPADVQWDEFAVWGVRIPEIRFNTESVITSTATNNLLHGAVKALQSLGIFVH